jgi:DNA invertase Pin-like site-specific DNA recombinase
VPNQPGARCSTNPTNARTENLSPIKDRECRFSVFVNHLIVEHNSLYVAAPASTGAPMSPKKPKRVALYLRVSTSEQTTRNQRRELHAVAERHNWHVVTTFEDAGISGAEGRDKRPGFDRLMMAVARREIDMVAAWSVDRLGRSLTDLLGFLTDLHAKGVDLFLHQQGLDTSTPSGRALFQMLGVFAEFERAMIRERVMAGLSRARAEGKQLGRRSVEQSNAKKVKAALALRSKEIGIRRIAREVGLGVGTVIRLIGAEAEAHPA